jgi:hypothetical protein
MNTPPIKLTEDTYIAFEEMLRLKEKGCLINKSVSTKTLETIYKKLRPYQSPVDLIRLGCDGDGGYLLPNDLDGLGCCFSPGVDDKTSFEKDLLEKYGIGSHLADYSVDITPKEFKPISFEKKYIGSHDIEPCITLENWVKSRSDFDEKNEFILQMDIEGAEYDTILSTPPYLLNQFRIIIMELHWVDQWGLIAFNKIANAFLGKLLNLFNIVHIHPNNCEPLTNINGCLVPPVLEITLLRKDRFNSVIPNYVIPHPLDFPNSRDYINFQLPELFKWHDKKIMISL